MRFAHFVVPHIGGTYTVYRSVRAALAAHDIDVQWLGVGPCALAAFRSPEWESERSHGAVAGGDLQDERAQANALLRYLEHERFDGVFVNVLSDRVRSNIVRYLDARVLRVMTVHNITVGTYAAARALRDHVHATVCVSPRIRNDLIEKNGFPAEYAHVIPTGIDVDRFLRWERKTAEAGGLRLLSMGRIVDSDKGVFWLPEMMKQLADCPVRLTIVGDGPDRAELERRCASLGDRVEFLGSIPPANVPEVISKHDIFIMPSRFEGLGLALVEAMAGGCVPIASRIRGVTDFVVRDRETGFLFEIGDIHEASRLIRNLACDSQLFDDVSRAAKNSVSGRFGLGEMANGYVKVVQSLIARKPKIAEPLSIDQWQYPSGLRGGLRTYLPNDLKNWLRVLRERLH